MDYNFSNIVKEKLEEALKSRGRVNVLVAGKTGVGKSTLINSIFQGDFAATGHGKPVTQNTREIIKDGIPLHIFDTKGLELEDFSETLRQLEQLINQRATMTDANEHIHCAWICISEDGRRVEPAEINLVAMLAKQQIPVGIVVTKARADKGFKTTVQQLVPQASNVISVRAIEEELDDGLKLPPKGLTELVDWSMGVVPEGQRNAFAAAQKVVLRFKQERSHLIVLGSATTAAAIGATPIPFADAALLVPVQIGMLAGISAAFGLPLTSAFLTTLVGATIAGAGGTLAGRSIVSGLLLLIPGAGIILKGVISGTTAVLFTTAFGEAYIATLSALIEENPKNPPTPEQIASRLVLEMKKRNPFK